MNRDPLWFPILSECKGWKFDVPLVLSVFIFAPLVNQNDKLLALAVALFSLS